MKTPDEQHAISQWLRIVEHRDASALNYLLADEVVFLSPIVHTPQKGKHITMMYLAAAVQVFGNETFEYVRTIIGPHDAMLEFKTTIDDVEVNGVDIISWNDQNQITEFKVMVRPLKAIQLIHAQMKVMLGMGGEK